MKKLFFVSAFALMAANTLINCNSPARKNVEAQTEEEANQNDVPKAKEEYVTNIDNYRRQIDDRIAANARSIAELKSKSKTQKQEANGDFRMKLDQLEQKNNDLKKRMEEYTTEGKEKWDTFKNGINHDIDELEKSLKELTTKK